MNDGDHGDHGHRRLAFAGFIVDLDRLALYGGGSELPLRPKSFETLVYLATHAGVVVTKDELLAAIWAPKIVTDASLTQCLSEIRQTLGDDDKSIIRTVPRRGYIFDVPVTEVGADASGSAEPAPVEVPRPTAARRGFRPILVVAMALLVIWLSARFRHADPTAERPPGDGTPPPNSIAVLPFVDMSPAGDEAYFGEGMAEEIINRLAQSDSLLVIARTSSFSFRGRPALDIETIAAQLNVASILEGSIRTDKTRIRVTAQLIDSEDSAHLWSQTYDRSRDSALEIQEDIAAQVATALHATLFSTTLELAQAKINPLAHEQFLRGRFLFHRRGEGDVNRARDLFESALTLAPDYGPAWAAAAGTYAVLLAEGALPRGAGVAALKIAIERALEYAPNMPETQMRAAQYYQYFGDSELSRAHYARALELGSNSPQVQAAWAGYLAHRQDLEGAIAHQQRAVELDPLAVLFRNNLVWWLLASGRYEEALAEARTVRELSPDDSSGVEEEIQALVLLGKFDEALSVVAQLSEREDRCLFEAMSWYGLEDPGRADASVECMATGDPVGDAARAAMLHAYRHDNDRAFAALELTIDSNCGNLTGYSQHPLRRYALKFSPFFRDLHADPRWPVWLAAVSCEK